VEEETRGRKREASAAMISGGGILVGCGSGKTLTKQGLKKDGSERMALPRRGNCDLLNLAKCSDDLL
jgi:hypothetical protein